MGVNGTVANDKFHRRAVSVDEARFAVLGRVRPTEAVEVGLAEALGHSLAEEVRTAESVPHFRRAGMDGFAVLLADVVSTTSAEPVVPTLTAFLAEDYLKLNGFARYVQGYWYSQEGQIRIKPVGSDKSSASLTIKDANCLIAFPPTKTGFRAGQLVEAIPLEGTMGP